MEIQKTISEEKNRALVGKTLKVLIDRTEGDYFIARSERDAPDVDGEVLIEKKSNQLIIGEFYDVEIYDFNEYDLYGNLKV
jgi:ribosomal protein S12 methylthiotransferase